MSSAACGRHVVAALAVVNAVGSVYDRHGQIIAGPDPVEAVQRTREPTNTTLGIVATTAALDRAGVTKLAQMAHDGFARAIKPAHTMADGDLVFGLSVPAPDADQADVSALGAMAAEAMQDAIIDAVLQANATLGP